MQWMDGARSDAYAGPGNGAKVLGRERASESMANACPARPAFLSIVASIAGLASIVLQARAEEAPRVMIAAIGSEDARPPYRQHPSISTGYDVWRLAQNGDRGNPDIAADRGTILVAIKPSMPEGAEAEIAKHYGLEIDRQVKFGTLELRLISFRVPASRDVNALLDQLRGDPRVSSAQHNFAYRPKVPPAAEAHVRARRDLQRQRSLAHGPSLAAKPVEMKDSLPKGTARSVPRQGQIAAADVLAGGL